MRLEYAINWGAALASIVAMIVAFRRQPVKDWIIVFFLKGFLSSIFNQIFVAYGLLSYPVRLFPNAFDTTIVFEWMAYPMLCVFYNQTSYKSNLQGILLQAVAYSVPPTIFEWWLSEYTQVVKFHRGWNWGYSLLFFMATFLTVRATIALIRTRTAQAA